jgi:cholesterol oxidase
MTKDDPDMKRMARCGYDTALAFQGREWIVEKPRSRRLWYPMCRSGFDFFLLDTRSKRVRQRVAGTSTLMSTAQWQALEAWLENVDPERPKFIVSGSVMLPRSLDAVWAQARDLETGYSHRPETRGDCWSAFPEEQARLLDAIVRHGRNNVVFVSGDYHMSSFSALVLQRQGGGPELKAYSVVSPPAYAPFPFANDRADRIATKDALLLPSGTCVYVDTEWALDGSGFAEVCAFGSRENWHVQATWYDQEGEAMKPDPRRPVPGA